MHLQSSAGVAASLRDCHHKLHNQPDYDCHCRNQLLEEYLGILLFVLSMLQALRVSRGRRSFTVITTVRFAGVEA